MTAAPDSLLFRERVGIAAAGMSQETTVQLNPADATVRQVDQQGGAAGQTSAIHLTYAGGRVRGSSTVPQPSGTPKSLTIDTTVTPGVYDDNALPIVLPALPLAVGKTINVGVFARGMLKRLFTRIYFAGDPANAADPILALVPPERRDTLIAKPDPTNPNVWRFDIRVQGGADETVFLDA